MYFKDIIIVGGGSLALEVSAIIKVINEDSDSTCPKLRVRVINDDLDKSRLNDIADVLEYTPEIIEDLSEISKTYPDVEYVIAVGQPEVREAIYLNLRNKGLRLLTIQSTQAHIDKTAQICEGAIIYPFVYVGPKAEIQENVVLNVGAVIGHHVIIGRSSVVSPKVDINGYGFIGNECLIGAAAVINPSVSVGKKSKISAGSVLTHSIGDGFLVSGNPAKGRQMFRV